MITVLTSATSERLASLANVKESLDITDSANDSALERFIDRASGRIARYCGRPLTVQRYEVFQPAHGGVTLQLPHRTIRTLFSLYDSTDTGQAALSSTGYRLDKDKGQISRDAGWPWSAQFGANEITHDPSAGNEFLRWYAYYSAGYIPADGKDSGSTWDGTTATGSTVPPELEDAVIGLVRRSWLSRNRDPNVTSERVGELSVTYRDAQLVAEVREGIPSEVADLLAPYKSII